MSPCGRQCAEAFVPGDRQRWTRMAFDTARSERAPSPVADQHPGNGSEQPQPGEQFLRLASDP
jgi:hypothetical protein